MRVASRGGTLLPATRRTKRSTKRAPAKKAARKTSKKTTPKTRKAAPKKAAKAPAKKAARKTTKRAARKTAAPGAIDPNTVTLQPMLAVPDMNAELRFLEALGFQTVMTMPGPGGAPVHAVLSLGNAIVHLDPVAIDGMPPMPPGPMNDRWEANKKGPRGLGASFYVMTSDVADIAKRLETLGAPIVQPIMDTFWGDRTVMAYDPAGYLWSFAQHIKDVSPQDMAKALENMAPPA